MTEIKSRLRSATNREQWAARRASFVAKAKATKAVWFPPKTAQAGKKTTSAAKKATKRTTKKSTGAAKQATNGTKKATAAR